MPKTPAPSHTALRLAALVACALLLSCRVSPTGALIGPSIGSQPWWLVRSAHFTVRTDVGAVEAREIAIDLERTYRILLDLGFPMEKDPGLVTDVIVFRSVEDYKRVGSQGSGGYYTRRFAPWGAAGPTFLTYGGLSEASRPIFVHELTHRFIHYALPQAPLWLNEGLAEYFETISVDGGKAVLGRSSRLFKRGDSWTMGSPGIPIDALPPISALLTMDAKAFYAARGVPAGAEGSEAEKQAARLRSANYAGAWATVHMLKNGDPERAALLQRWMEKMIAGAPAQASFDQVFGHVSLEDLEAERRAFLERHVTREIPILRTDYDATGAPPVEDRAMRPAEIAVMWGWAYRQKGNAGRAEATRQAEAALQADPSSPDAHLLLAALADDAAALPALEREIRLAARSAPDSEPAAYALFSLQSDPRSGARLRPEADDTIAKWAPRAKGADFLNGLAWYMALHGRADEAVALARRATQADPSCDVCFDTAAVALFRSGQYKAAIEVEELAAGLAGESGWTDEFFQQADLFRAAQTAVVLWKKRPDPGRDPSLLPPSVIDAVNAAQIPHLQACYRRGRERDPKLFGAVVVRGEIGKDGKIISTSALPQAEWNALPNPPSRPPLPDAAVTACIVEQLGVTRFPESSAPSTFTASFSFEPPRKKD